MDNERRIHARVSLEAKDGLYRAARAMAVSVTALLEALGRDLADPDSRLLGVLQETLTEQARDVEAERRRRG